MFTAAIVVAGQAGGSGSSPWINWLAITFVVARVLHGVLYVANLAPLRSLIRRAATMMRDGATFW